MNTISIYSATQVVTYNYDKLIDNGKVHGNDRRWFTLMGATNRNVVIQTGDRDGYIINNGNFVATTPITVTPLAGDNVDLYFS